MDAEDGQSGEAGGGTIVRRLRPDEWLELRTLRLRALADSPDAFGANLAEAESEADDSWQRQASAEGRVTIVAEDAGRLVGMASGGPAPVDNRVGHLGKMWVEPAARGKGVAAAMVAAVVEWALGAGYPALALGVSTSSGRAIALYERLGFVDTGRRFHPPARPGLEMQLMVRTLV